MKIYTGIDIIEVGRIKENIEKHGDKFLNKIYSNREIEYSEKKGVQKYQTYAGKFAAKEAVFKAVSNILDNKFEVEWKDIEILNDENGRPFVSLNWKYNNNIQIDLSISHIELVAISSVSILFMEV